MFTINQPCIFGKCCCTKKFLGTFISFRTFQLNKQTEGGNNQSHITNEDNINWSRNQIHYPTLEPGIYLQTQYFLNHQSVIFIAILQIKVWISNVDCEGDHSRKPSFMYRCNFFFVFLNARFQIICTLKMSKLGCKDIGYGPLLLTFIEQRECATIILARVKKAKQYQIHRSLICSVNVHNWMDVFPMGKFVLLKLFYQTVTKRQNKMCMNDWSC